MNCLKILASVIPILRRCSEMLDKPGRVRLHSRAVASIGIDASPNDVAPDELGCAETVNAIHKAEFGVEIGGDVSTYRMYRALKDHPDFTKVDAPLPGDVVISPTGYGGTDEVTNGHVGIVGDGRTIMSNDSRKGTWESNYDISSWTDRYVHKGKYPMYYFRRT